MACLESNKLQKYLEEDLSPKEMASVEAHLEDCSQCQQHLDQLLSQGLDLPSNTGGIDDEVVIGKIKARRKGIWRITIYGIFGFILGLFSRFYTADNFIVTKAIMALPYKLAEFALGIFFSGNRLSPFAENAHIYLFNPGMGYFPYHPILGIAVELVTPAIIATFTAIMIGYLVSDKRVFRRQNIVKFVASGLLVFGLWLGVVHGIYSHTLNKIDGLEGIKAVVIYQKEESSTSWLLRIDQYNLGQPEYGQLLSGLSQGEELPAPSTINELLGYQILFELKGGGKFHGHLDKDNGIMITPSRKQYQLSRETLELFQQVTGRAR